MKLPEPLYQSFVAADSKIEYRPYYTADQMRQAIKDALEEAAKVCDAKQQEYLSRDVRNQHSHGAGLGAAICADAIRKLKESV